MTNPIGGSYSANKLSYSTIPCGQSNAIRFTAPWSSIDNYDVNFNNAIEQGQIDGIQMLYVDNLDNSNAVDINVTGLNQRLRVAASSCAYLPVLSTNPARFTISSTIAADQLTNFIAGNFPIPAIHWAP